MSIQIKTLTPEIEEKLNRMSDDLLKKTIVRYEQYNYDETIVKKAFEILEKRGIYIESIEKSERAMNITETQNIYNTKEEYLKSVKKTILWNNGKGNKTFVVVVEVILAVIAFLAYLYFTND